MYKFNSDSLPGRVLSPVTFKILIIISTMFMSVPYIHHYFGGYVKYVLVLGLIICVWQLLCHKVTDIFKYRENLLLPAFVISYAVTVFINRELYFASNVKQLVYMAVFFFLLYMMASLKNNGDIRREVNTVSCVFLIMSFVFSLISFLMFLAQYHFPYNFTYTAYYILGVDSNRLWGLYNPNTGAMINAISILVSLMFIFGEKKALKVFSVINAILQFWCLILTGSRSSSFALLSVVMVGAFIFVLKSKEDINIARIAKSVLASVLCAALIFGASYVSKAALSYMPSLLGDSAKTSLVGLFEDVRTIGKKSDDTKIRSPEAEDKEKSEDKNDPGSEDKDIKQTDIERSDTVSGGVLTGREYFWSAALKTVGSNLIFGVTREGVYDSVSQFLEIPQEKYNALHNDLLNGGLHNIYLTVLVSSGLLGFLILAAFTVIMVSKFIRHIVKSKRLSIEFILCVLITLLFLITELVEGRILYQVNIFYVLFWIYAGYASALSRDDDLC